MIVNNTKIILTAVYALIAAVESFGHNGNGYVQRGFAQEFGQDGFDQGKRTGLIDPYSPNNGPQYSLGWNGYRGGKVFNPYRKLGHAGYQNQGFDNGGFGFGDGGQLFGVPQPVVNYVGNQRRGM